MDYYIRDLFVTSISSIMVIICIVNIISIIRKNKNAELNFAIQSTCLLIVFIVGYFKVLPILFDKGIL